MLVEAPRQSIRRAAPAPAAGVDVTKLLAVLWRRKFVIVLCGLLGAALAGAIAHVLPHRYLATAQVLIDPRDLKVLDREVLPRSVATDSGITIVESQVQVLSSNSILEAVIQRLDLDHDPEFNGTEVTAISRIMNPFVELLRASPLQPSHLIVLQTLQKQVDVHRPERTFVIELSVKSNDPQKSVRIADEIVAAYLADQAQYRSATSEGAAVAIDGGLQAMKEKVSGAEARIATYKSSNNLLLASGRLIGEQQLTDANNQLSVARTELGRLKARLDDIEASRRTPGGIPEIASSVSLSTLKKQLWTLSGDIARNSTQLMPKHPAMLAMLDQQKEVKRAIDQEVAGILAAARHDYERANANFAAVSASVESLKSQMTVASQAQIGLRELERDLDASRQLYEQSVARSRESREQARVNTSNVRVISAAIPAPARSFPPKALVVYPAGFSLGLALGSLGVLALSRGRPARSSRMNYRVRPRVAITRSEPRSKPLPTRVPAARRAPELQPAYIPDPVQRATTPQRTPRPPAPPAHAPAIPTPTPPTLERIKLSLKARREVAPRPATAPTGLKITPSGRVYGRAAVNPELAARLARYAKAS